MPKKRADLWFFRTGGVVIIVGLKPTDNITVNHRVYGQYEWLTTKQVNEISEVHGAKKRSK